MVLARWFFAFVLTVTATNGILAQPKRVCDLIPNYPKHEAELHRKYLERILVRVEEKGYDRFGRTGKLEGTAIRTTIFGNSRMRMNSTIKRVGETEELKSASLYTFDELYQLSEKAGNYTIDERHYDSTKITAIEENMSKCGAFVPLTYNGWMRLRAIDRLNTIRLAEEFHELVDGTYDGRPAAVLTSQIPLGPVTKSYFDPSNNYALLGFETDKTIDLKSKKFVSIKLVGRVTYEPSDLGYPVPKRFVTSFVTPDGKETPRVEIIYSDWKRYTPSDDDFDLEKQFGVKPLPRPAEAGPSPLGAGGSGGRGIGLWLWITAGVLAVVTAGLAVVIWRKRRGATAS